MEHAGTDTLKQPDTSEVISHISRTSKRSRILGALYQKILTPSDIATQFETDRRDAHRILNGWEKWGGIIKIDESGRTLSVPGKIIARKYFVVCDEIGRKQVKKLSKSDERWAVLKAIGKNPITKRELVRREDLPTRQTINKTIEEGSDEGWIREHRHPNSLAMTHAGKHTIGPYDELEQTTTQTIDKIHCLCDIDIDPAKFPVQELSDAEVAVATSSEPYAPIQCVRKTARTDCEYMRAMTSIHDPETTKAFAAVQARGTQMDVITPTSAVDELPETDDELGLIVRFSLAENYNWRGYPGSPSLGFGIYDEKKVVFGPRDLEQASRPEAVIVSTNDAIIEWAINVFNEHMEKTEPIPIDRFVRQLSDAGVDFQNLFQNHQDGEEKQEADQ